MGKTKKKRKGSKVYKVVWQEHQKTCEKLLQLCTKKELA